MATIKDVAKRANLSPTTVSRVLNNRGYISEKTKKLVYDVMEEMNYHPNNIARALLSKKSGLLAVIVPDSNNPFFSELVKEIETNARANGYSLILCNSLESYHTESQHLKTLQEQNIDGLIVCSHLLDKNSYKNISFPVVAFDQDYHNEQIPIICSNNALGGAIAAHHLKESGCKHILHISGNLSTSWLLGHGRYYGFKKYCDQHGIFYENFPTNNHFSYDYYYNFVKKTIGNKVFDFDGAFCSNDMIALALYNFLQERNVRVPENFKIVGFDNTKLMRHVRPKLTTVAQDIPASAKALVATLISMVEGNSFVKKITLLDVRLMKGETT